MLSNRHTFRPSFGFSLSLILFASLLSAALPASANVKSLMPDFYAEPGLNPFRDPLSANVNEAIDLVTLAVNPDTDHDGLPDSNDNCTQVVNPDQRDTDHDGHGNLCDADLNNDGATNTLDLNLFKLAYGSKLGDPNYTPDADFNNDGVIDSLDLAILQGRYRKPPGPSNVPTPEQLTYYHLDALGSPVAGTDAQGNITWTETYQPYGERIQKSPAAAANPRWYTGHPQDPETGLVYAGARYYDPVVGRFMGVDPQAYQDGQLHTFNRYAYANDNPYRYTDPDGRSSIDERLRNAMGRLPDAGFGPGGTGGGSWRFEYKSSPRAMAEAEQRAAQRLEETLAKGARPPNMSPPGAGRQGAFNEAKRARDIPTSMQPDRTLPNIDKRGNLQPGRVYEYDLPAPGGGIRTEIIRDDAAGHVYTDNPSQNRGPHFNDAAKKHYDY